MPDRDCRCGRRGFRLDPSLLTDVRCAGLLAADMGGLVCLWLTAWSSGGVLPADDVSLAVLSRLGEAWRGSALRERLAAWFVPAGDGCIRSLDVDAQRDHQRGVSEARRAAGKASGEARRNKGGGGGPRTNVEQMFNKCSTFVQPPPEVVQSAQEAEAEKVLDEKTEAELRKCAHRTPLPPPETAGTPAIGISSPPYPPIYDSNSSSFGMGGGGGERAGETTPPSEPAEGHRQMTLFGVEDQTPAGNRQKGGASASGSRRGPKVASSHMDAANAILDDYVRTVKSAHPRSAGADKAAAAILASGEATVEQLNASVKHYAAHCGLTQKDAIYRKSPYNFFKRCDRYYHSFIEETNERKQGPGSEPNRDVGRGGRLHTGRTFRGPDILVGPDGEFTTPPTGLGYHSTPGGQAVGPNPLLALATPG